MLDMPAEPQETAVIGHCRNLVLNQYNPFARFAHWAERFHQAGAAARPVEITSHKAFRPFPRGLVYRLKSRCPV